MLEKMEEDLFLVEVSTTFFFEDDAKESVLVLDEDGLSEFFNLAKLLPDLESAMDV